MNDKIYLNSDTCKSARQDTFVMDRPFVLTQNKTLVTGMPYLYSEGNRSVAVRLLEVWEENDFIYLSLEELQSGRTFKVSWNLDYDGGYFLWSLADLPSIMNISKK